MTGFSVNLSELRLAIQKKDPSAIEKVAVDLVYATHEFMQDTEQHPAYPFEEAMRYAMNDMELEFERRKVYRVVLGSYFGTHGNRVAARNRQAGKKPRPAHARSKSTRVEVLEEPNGQLKFRM